jgi:hypothetical protein
MLPIPQPSTRSPLAGLSSVAAFLSRVCKLPLHENRQQATRDIGQWLKRIRSTSNSGEIAMPSKKALLKKKQRKTCNIQHITGIAYCSYGNEPFVWSTYSHLHIAGAV